MLWGQRNSPRAEPPSPSSRETQAEQRDDPGFIIEERSRCLFLYARAGYDRASDRGHRALRRAAAPDSVIDVRLARILAVDAVMGEDADLRRLWREADVVERSFALVDDLLAHSAETATPELRNWLAGPSTTPASRFFAGILLGASNLVADELGPSSGRRSPPIPRDSEGFGACLEVFGAQESLRPHLHRLRDASSAWNTLIDIWDELEGDYRASATDRVKLGRIGTRLRALV